MSNLGAGGEEDDGFGAEVGFDKREDGVEFVPEGCDYEGLLADGFWGGSVGFGEGVVYADVLGSVEGEGG